MHLDIGNQREQREADGARPIRSATAPNPASNLHPKLDHLLVATDFSPASEMATLCALATARRQRSKIFLAHVVTSRSEQALTEGWRSGQAAITAHLVADRLDHIQHELLVRSGEIWPVLQGIVHEKQIDAIVLGSRGRTGMRKFFLGSVAEGIFRKARCPVLTVGPNVARQEAEAGFRRILVPTGFAPHSLVAVRYAAALARRLNASLCLMNVVTDPASSMPAAKPKIFEDHMRRLQQLGATEKGENAACFVEFGPAPARIVQTAAAWQANLVVLGLRPEGPSIGETAWAKAYEILSNARCPVLTLRAPQ